MKMWVTAIAILSIIQPGIFAQQGPIIRKHGTPAISQKSQSYQWQPLVVKAHTIVAVGREHLPSPFTLMPWMHPLKNRGLMYQSLVNPCQVLIVDFPASETDLFQNWVSSFPKDQPIKGSLRPHIGASTALTWPKIRLFSNPTGGMRWVYIADIVRGHTRARFIIIARSAPDKPLSNGPPDVIRLEKATDGPQSPIYGILGGYVLVSVNFYPWQTASLPIHHSNGGSLVSLWTTSSGQLDVRKAKAMTVSMVRKALAKGAAVDARNQDGITTLITACAFKHIDIVKVLLASGANVNAHGNEHENALLAAGGNAALMKLLLSHGADVNAKDNAGASALDIAKSQKDAPIIALLQAAVADHQTSGSQ